MRAPAARSSSGPGLGEHVQAPERAEPGPASTAGRAHNTLHRYFGLTRPRKHAVDACADGAPHSKRQRRSTCTQHSVTEAAGTRMPLATLASAQGRVGPGPEAGRAARGLASDMRAAADQAPEDAAAPHGSSHAGGGPAAAAAEARVASMGPPTAEDPKQTTLMRFFASRCFPYLAVPTECQLYMMEFLDPASLTKLRSLSQRCRVPDTAIRRAAARCARLDPAYGETLTSYDATFAMAPYMASQPDLRPSMRTIVVDWLVDVAELYRLRGHTLHLAVGILDRYLEMREVPRRQFQLISLAALLIAMKHEERPGSLRQMADLTDGAFTADQLAEAERHMLLALDYRLSQPTVVSFIGYFCDVTAQPPGVLRHTPFFADAALHSYDLADTPRQLVAAAVICIARETNGIATWTPRLRMVSGIRSNDPRMRHAVHCILSIARREDQMQSLHALHSKYRLPRHGGILRNLQTPPALAWSPVPGESARTQAPSGGEGEGNAAGAAAESDGSLVTPVRRPEATSRRGSRGTVPISRPTTAEGRSGAWGGGAIPPNPPPPPHRIEITNWRVLQRTADARAGGTGTSAPPSPDSPAGLMDVIDGAESEDPLGDGEEEEEEEEEAAVAVVGHVGEALSDLFGHSSET